MSGEVTLGAGEMFLGGIAAFAVLALIVKTRARTKRARVVAEIARMGTNPVSLAGRVLTTAGMIVGGQWLVITYAAHNTSLLLGVLAGPALFAAYTLTKALTVMQVGPTPRRGGGRR
jgi:hypothetical protein